MDKERERTKWTNAMQSFQVDNKASLDGLTRRIIFPGGVNLLVALLSELDWRF